MMSIMKSFSSESFIYGCILLGTIGTALDNLWYLNPSPSHCESAGAATVDPACATIFTCGRVILFFLIVLDIILFLNTFYFFHHVYNVYQRFCQDLRVQLIKPNQSPKAGRSRNQVPLLSPFLRLVELFVDSITMTITGIIMACLVGLCMFALLALGVGFFILISLIPRTTVVI